MASRRDVAWDLLAQHARAMAAKPIRALFDADPGRVDAMTRTAAGVTVDLSRQRVDAETFAAFEALAEVQDIRGRLEAMRAGAIVNPTERRPALHVALRGSGGDEDVRRAVTETGAAMADFAAAFREGRILGAGGAPLDTIVHIGIGGSDLGPRLLYDALKPFRRKGASIRFAANVDGADIADALEDLDPGRTLVVVVSKTFTTQETMANATAARAWLEAALGPDAPARQIIGVTAAPERARAWGAGAVFPFWDWVGGRYSLWSAVGLSVACVSEAGVFEALLAGARAMDEHVFAAPWRENLAFRAAAVQCFNRLLGATSYVVSPYQRRLQLLPAFLQQLEMESNGKRVDADGAALARSAAGVTWGDAGTNGQHSFFQLLHQGHDPIPVEFLLVVEGSEGPPAQREMLLANVLAQAQALYLGKTTEAAAAEAAAKGQDASLAPHRTFPGDRPSTIVALDRLDAAALGALLAFYEHRTVLQAWLAGVNPFDQWGVELGKTMAAALLPALEGGLAPADADPTTLAWLVRLKRPRG